MLLGMAGIVEGAGWGRCVVFAVLVVVVGMFKRPACASPVCSVAVRRFFCPFLSLRRLE